MLHLLFHKGIQKTLRRHERKTKQIRRGNSAFSSLVFSIYSLTREHFDLIVWTLYPGIPKNKTTWPRAQRPQWSLFLLTNFIQSRGRCCCSGLIFSRCQQWSQVSATTTGAHWMKAKIHAIILRVWFWHYWCVVSSSMTWERWNHLVQALCSSGWTGLRGRWPRCGKAAQAQPRQTPAPQRSTWTPIPSGKRLGLLPAVLCPLLSCPCCVLLLPGDPAGPEVWTTQHRARTEASDACVNDLKSVN